MNIFQGSFFYHATASAARNFGSFACATTSAVKFLMAIIIISAHEFPACLATYSSQPGVVAYDCNDGKKMAAICHMPRKLRKKNFSRSQMALLRTLGYLGTGRAAKRTISVTRLCGEGGTTLWFMGWATFELWRCSSSSLFLCLNYREHIKKEN